MNKKHDTTTVLKLIRSSILVPAPPLGELVIQSGQLTTKKKNRVTFAISDDESDDDDALDNQTIA